MTTTTMTMTQVHALDHRVVALVDRVEEEAAHAGQAEDLLDDHGAAEDLRDLEAEHGDHGDHRVLEAVLEHHHALAQPLGPGGAHVVLAQHLEEHGAGEAHDGGGGGDAEDEGGQEELGEVGPRVLARTR